MAIRIFNLLIFLFLIALLPLKAQPFLKIDSLKLKVQRTAELFVDPHGKVKGYYSIDNSGVSIFASPDDKVQNKVECKIYWQELILFQNLLKRLPHDLLIQVYQGKKNKKFPDSLYQFPIRSIKFMEPLPAIPKPLRGLKIALDPGHVAGDMATGAYELKYLRLKQDSIAGVPSAIDLIEGNLTLATAFYLKEQLEAAGAEVILTRDKANYSSFGLTYNEWLKNAKKRTYETAYYKGEISLAEKNRFIKKGNPKDIFQNYFRYADLYERARIINAYKPDLTVVIHYNVDEKNKPWTSPTSKNFNMVFVPGDIKPVFLNRVEKRLELLRLLLSEDIVNSISLGTNLVKSFERVLEVPTALPHHASYLNDDCITTFSTGVYVRNLALTRLIHGPIAYGETLYQDNINECHLLGNYSHEINGVKTSERVKQVAQAYFEGIMSYALDLKKD